MLKKLTVLSGLAVVLFGCGGSDPVTIDSFGLQAQASAVEDQTTTGTLPGQQPRLCFPLTVSFSIVGNQPLPGDISATSITLTKSGSVVLAQDVPSTDSTFSSDRTIQGRASACGTAPLTNGDTLDVSIIMKTGNEHVELKTTAKLQTVA
jgi:hypothetical protein